MSDLEDYSNETKEMEFYKRYLVSGHICRQFKGMHDYRPISSTHTYGNINEYILDKLAHMNNNNSIDALNFDIFISLKTFILQGNNYHPGTQYTMKIWNRRMLKENLCVTDEIIDKMTTVIGTIKNRKVYALYSLPENGEDNDLFIGNTVAKYCKFRNVMRMMNKKE